MCDVGRILLRRVAIGQERYAVISSRVNEG